MAINLEPKSNIANKVRNTKLPRTRPLMPLFEVISNSIHAISELKTRSLPELDGSIRINVIRNGKPETLEGMDNNDSYPVKSFEVIDNGIGLNDDNLGYFAETDTDHKINIGGKGVGRFVCLKAFQKLLIKSFFQNVEGVVQREFEFHAKKEAFQKFKESKVSGRVPGTTIYLSEYKEEYQKHVPRQLILLARAIVTHFQLYFIRNEIPEIIIANQNRDFINLNALFETEFKDSILTKEFEVLENTFTIFLTKVYNSLSHKLHFCAHNRSVKEESLGSKILDLGKYPIKDALGQCYYQAFVVGDLLDENVDSERVGFTFSTEDEVEESVDEDSMEISLFRIRRAAINAIEELLEDYLNEIRNQKIENYEPIVLDEMPQYRTVMKRRMSQVRKLPPNLTKQKLDIELYKIEVDWRLEIKQEEKKLIEESKDIQNLEQYLQRYDKFLTEMNELGQVELARYVVHRKAVIDLLEELLGEDKELKFTNEDLIHSVFFPIRTTSDEVPYEKQNLWLLDERLTYHTFLASDKKFNSIPQVSSNSGNRTDLLIFNDALAFTENNLPPYNSFTIVEFKKPQRDNYRDNDPGNNPLDQVEKYIDDLLDGNVTNRVGRVVRIDRSTPFYVYIVCDITDSFEKILQKREFVRSPDGLGYYRFKSQYYSAYIEVLPFEKVLTDAKKRNRILFDKLGISYK